MSNKLFLKIFFAAILISFSALRIAAQDTVKHAAAKSKTYIKPAVAKPVTTYPPKPVTILKAVAPTPNTTSPAANVYSQPVAAAVAPTDRSINGQYQYLLTKLYGYQKPMFAAFHKSITDSITAVSKKIKPLQNSVAALGDTVKDLHKQLGSQQTQLNDSTTKVDNINLLGINMTKSAYNMLMWGLVVAFGAIATIVIIRSASYNREAKYRVKLYDDLDEEYKGYKAKANDKEKKLARELQTARNKIEEITGNPY